MDPEDVLTVWREAADHYPNELALARKSGTLPAIGTQDPSVPPASQNAASVYRLMAGSRDPAAQALMALWETRAPTPAQLQQTQQAASACADLQRAHLAAARDACTFPRSPTGGTPELAALRQAARLLSAQSLLLAFQGKRQQAVDNQALALRVVQHAAAGKMMVHWLVAIAVDAIALAGMERILIISHGDPPTAARVAATLEQHWRPLSLATMIAGECAWQQAELVKIRRKGFQPYLRQGIDELYGELPGLGAADKADTERERKQAQEELTRSLRPATWAALTSDKTAQKHLLDGSAAFLLQRMRRLHAAADLPYRQARPVFLAFQNDLETPASMPDGPRALRLIPGRLAIGFWASLQFRSEAIARARTLLAAARLLAAHPDGAYPDTVARLPIDPFSGKPLSYRKEGAGRMGGFVFHSLGPEGTFDGGRPGVPLHGQQSSLLCRWRPASDR